MLAPDSLVLEGRFRVIRPLGSGGMGEVYLGEQVSLGRKVAIKVLHHDLHMQAGMVERFKREARLLSAVEHPAVVRIIDFGESGDAACLVMELVEGVSLHEALQTGPLAPARALTVLHQLAEGLAAIHDQGIIHRDIKPENVFLTRGPRGEQARLLDFGIARLVEPDADSAVSQVGVVLGTPEYLSPEQAVGARVDVRSDLYCLGVLAYRILSGRLPFDGPTARQFIAQHANAAPLPLDRAAPTLATQPTLVALVMRLLEKEPANRFQTAHALAEALTAVAAMPLPAHTAPPGVLVPATTPPLSSGTAAFGAAAAPALSPEPISHRTAAFGAAPPVPSGESGGPEPRGATQVLPPTSSGTAAFGVAPPPGASIPPPTGSGTAAFGVAHPPGASIPPPTGSGTAVFGAAAPPARSGLTGLFGSSSVGVAGSGALAGKPQNLTLMLTSIQGFAELTSRQTREEHLRMLETYEQLLLPLVREYSGKLVQQRGDSLLAVFESPTGAVLCGMGMQDRLWRHNQALPPEAQLHVRTCLHAGEVLLARDSVLGEPMEVVKATEQVALAGEVTFTESVNLARNRAEVVAEPCGTIPLPGRGDPLQLYRSKRAAEGPPFGGRDMGSAPTEKRPVVAWKPSLGELSQKLSGLSRGPRGRVGAALAGGLLLLGGGALWLWSQKPEVQARRLVNADKPAEALKRLEAIPAEERKAPALRQVRALALHALKRHDEEYEALLALDAEARKDVEARVLDGLAEDFGESEGSKGLRKLLGALPKEQLHAHFEELAEGGYSPKQWGALRYLEAAQDTQGLDLVELYTTALASEDCGVRAKAARRLGALGGTGAVSALQKLAEQPRDKQPLGTKNCGQDEAEAALNALKKSN
ncbi:protein kinase domain-containing protein [Hyalangium rubrum]|uniref:Protein kinase n=1 Tax=Hyalangium rubrum TaxID=3103134 RepID=A0ABU5H1S1_9BACT|nr:protein kinase [Hyalangium sp. s54d21]MDY7227402.1 protein kinase [Hyalangium sp. s54d21]